MNTRMPEFGTVAGCAKMRMESASVTQGRWSQAAIFLRCVQEFRKPGLQKRMRGACTF